MLAFLPPKNYNANDGLQEFLPALSRFRNLQKLALAGVHCLNVGFDPPDCGNAYMGPGGDEYLQQVKREGEEAELRVAHMVFPVCASLQELWIGTTTKAVVDRSSDGSFKDLTMSEAKRAMLV